MYKPKLPYIQNDVTYKGITCTAINATIVL